MSDIDNIRRSVNLADTARAFGVDLQADGHEFEGLCPFHSERTPSFTVFPGKDRVWRFHCFGCGAAGDVIDFVEKIKGVGTAEAILILNGDRQGGCNVAPAQIQARDSYSGIIRLDPVAELAPNKKLVLYNPKREHTGNITPSMVFPYRRADGSVIGYVLRHDLPDGKKETPMVQWARLENGTECWCRLPFDKPRPLYGLDRIGSGQVFIVEGEKCADAFWKLRNKAVVSWVGGTYGIKHTDWSPLAGRDVIIWPDFDEPGYQTAGNIADIIKVAAKQVRFIDPGKGLHSERDDIGILPSAAGEWYIRLGGGYTWFVNEDRSAGVFALIDNVLTPIVCAHEDQDAPLVMPKVDA